MSCKKQVILNCIRASEHTPKVNITKDVRHTTALKKSRFHLGKALREIANYSHISVVHHPSARITKLILQIKKS